MGLFKRLFGAGRQGHPGFAEGCLTRAGWKPGRSCDLGQMEQALARAGFPLHGAARQLLGEYYGLLVDVPISGADGITGFVHFSPEMVLRFLSAADSGRLAALMPKAACPIGTTSGHTVFIFMDEDGRSYLLGMEWDVFAELAASPAEAVRALCDGRNGRVDSIILDAEGRRTRQTIRANDERRHWQLDQFPAMARFLPPVSLSPARRPPTWRAMVRSAEAALAKGGAPAGLLVTCGGFTRAPSGQWYFVAHCENCLYTRQQAGLQVSSPPPGIPPQFHLGECIPFTPPGNW